MSERGDFGERSGKVSADLEMTIVDLRSSPFLPRPTYHPCRLQKGSSLRSEDDRGVTQNIPEAGDAGTGRC